MAFRWYCSLYLLADNAPEKETFNVSVFLVSSNAVCTKTKSETDLYDYEMCEYD